MNWKLLLAANAALMVVIMFGTMVGHGEQEGLGVVGRVVALERVDASDCDDFSDDGRCAFESARRAFDRLDYYINHFRCSSASGGADIRIAPEYARFTIHDPGPVLMAKASNMLCKVDPRRELILIDAAELKSLCSRLEWKCNVVWVPDYDQSIAFIGRYP